MMAAMCVMQYNLPGQSLAATVVSDICILRHKQIRCNCGTDRHATSRCETHCSSCQVETSLFAQVVDRLSGQSLRLLALAVGVVRGLDKPAVGLMTQEQLESRAERFDLLGLLVLSNNVQPDVKDTIMELQST